VIEGVDKVSNTYRN
jgi:hypothetical protein